VATVRLTVAQVVVRFLANQYSERLSPSRHTRTGTRNSLRRSFKWEQNDST
jgi:TPP-dependent trihydroxycyclohexane-1,2-dione (THcHDO) dehydratase